MQKFTFEKRFGAHTASGKHLVYIPDQVVEGNVGSDKTFPVIRKDGSRTRAVLGSCVERVKKGLSEMAPVVVLQ